ncbi:hypothetical protein LPJ53_006295, partial [Coemansia erecta]
TCDGNVDDKQTPEPAPAPAPEPAPAATAAAAGEVAIGLYDELRVVMDLQLEYPLDEPASDDSYQKPAMLREWEKWFRQIVATQSGLSGEKIALQRRRGLLELHYMASISEKHSGNTTLSPPYDSWCLDKSIEPPMFGDQDIVKNVAESVEVFYYTVVSQMDGNNLLIRTAISAQSVDKTKYGIYFGALRRDETVKGYCHTIKAMLVFILRAIRHEPSHADLGCFVMPALKAKFEPLTLGESKINPSQMLELLGFLFEQYSPETTGYMVTQVVPAMLAVESIDDKGKMTSYYDISHVAVHFILFARLICFYKIITEIPQLETSTQVARIDELISTFANTNKLGS